MLSMFIDEKRHQLVTYINPVCEVPKTTGWLLTGYGLAMGWLWAGRLWTGYGLAMGLPPIDTMTTVFMY